MLEPSLAEAYDAARAITHRPFRAVCYSPFNSMFFDTFGQVRACCINAHYVLGDLKQQRLDEIWFGPRARRLRDAMLQYDLRLGCDQCQWQIRNGNFTNEHHSLSSVHAFKYDAFPVIKRDEKEFWPSNLEFNLSNVCNLECVTCNGDLSSLIRAKRENRAALPHAYGDEFFADLERYLAHVTTAQFLGGEPFLIKEHFRVWELMAALGKMSWVGIVTNGTVYNDRVEKVLQSLPVSLAMSIDGATKKTFEAIRVNASYETFMANCTRFLEYHRAHGRRMYFNFTLSRLNYHEFADFLLFADSLGCEVSICTLMDPEVYCLYKLDLATLRGVVAELERRDGEMQRSLTTIRHVWNDALNNLRNELANRRRSEAAAAAAPPASAPAPRTARLADRLAKAHAVPSEEEARARAQALAELGGWSGGGVVELLADRDDVITAVVQSNGELFARDALLLGRNLGELREHLAGRLGRNWDVSEGERSDERVDWTVLVGDDGHAPSRLRTIVLPRFDAGGTLAGLRVLLALRSPVAIG